MSDTPRCFGEENRFGSRLSAMKTTSRVEIGLCQTCQHVKIIENANHSRFYLCLLSNFNADFQKYPRLPVLACHGYYPQKWTNGPKEGASE